MDVAPAWRENAAAMEIRDACRPPEIAEVRMLFREYAAQVDAPACFAAFEEELAALPGEYAPPSGRLLLARDDDRAAGCAALRRLPDGSGEMKRLYVRAPFRGAGLGRELARRVIASARDGGCTRLVLDTLPTMRAAAVLYESLGFRRIAAYSPAPTPGAIFFELSLS